MSLFKDTCDNTNNLDYVLSKSITNTPQLNPNEESSDQINSIPHINNILHEPSSHSSDSVDKGISVTNSETPTITAATRNLATTAHNNNKHSINNNHNNHHTRQEDEENIKPPTTSSILTPFLSSHINDQSMKGDIDHKYCYRHNPDIRCNKTSDEKKLKEIQNSLEALPLRDREAISHVWSIFSAAPTQHRNLIIQGLLTQCCFPQLSTISQEVSKLIKIDFIATLPTELSLKILSYLDCQSLCNAAQVSNEWKKLADDDRVWRYMCEQHIDRKCPNCGWGLPLMAVKKLQESKKRRRDSTSTDECNRSSKSNKTTNDNGSTEMGFSFSSSTTPQPKLIEVPYHENNLNNKNKLVRKTRPWKTVYSERFKVERNWRKGNYKIKYFDGHKDGVTCIQYNNDDLLMTGSYDNTVKIWNAKTGQLIRTLEGHTRGIRTLIFDDQKLITGSLDSKIKVWNYRTGQCISTYAGHEDSVVSVDFHDKIICSGSADSTVKVWHVDTRTCYTLRGHTDWVNSVKIHGKSQTVFSASDDSTVRMWDLNTNKCIRVFGGVESNGHVGQVQSVIPITFRDKLIVDVLEDEEGNSPAQNAENSNGDGNANANAGVTDDEEDEDEEDDDPDKINFDDPKYPTHIITCSLDNTIKLWDIKKGKCIRTQFGHIEGVWSIAADTFRVVSGAHDKMVKVWDLQNGKCMLTIGGNSSPITCVGLGDSKVVCGGENGQVKMYCFDI